MKTFKQYIDESLEGVDHNNDLEDFYRNNEAKALAHPEVQRQLKTLFQVDGRILRSIVGKGPHDESSHLNYFIHTFNQNHGDLDRYLKLPLKIKYPDLKARDPYKGEFAYRYEHRDGTGLFNNSSLDYTRLRRDDDYHDIAQGFLDMQQPGGWSPAVVAASGGGGGGGMMGGIV